MKRLAFLLLLPAFARLHAESITVTADAHDRSGSVVTFQAPEAWRGKTLALEGKETLVQVDDTGRATFILPESLGKGQSLTYQVKPVTADGAASQVTTRVEGSTLLCAVKTGDAPKPIFTYQMQPGPVPEGTPEIFAHGAHLHPVFSPSGRLVTGNHPPDHPHQRGIWFAWTHTEFEGRTPDFWNMGKEKYGGVTGEVRFAKLIKSWSGPVQGGFTSSHRWIDHTGGSEKDMLQETWEVTVTPLMGKEGQPSLFLIDLISTQTCASNEPVKLPKYHYGGLGLRGNALWDPKPNVTMLTSNGDDRIKGNATKAKWVWFGGEVDGQTTGITVLMHPENFRFPQPLRLNPSNPQICIAPSVDGDWSIEPGKPYVSRYRLVIGDGAPDAAIIERLWADYAEPAKAKIAP